MFIIFRYKVVQFSKQASCKLLEKHPFEATPGRSRHHCPPSTLANFSFALPPSPLPYPHTPFLADVFTQRPSGQIPWSHKQVSSLVPPPPGRDMPSFFISLGAHLAFQLLP